MNFIQELIDKVATELVVKNQVFVVNVLDEMVKNFTRWNPESEEDDAYYMQSVIDEGRVLLEKMMSVNKKEV